MANENISESEKIVHRFFRISIFLKGIEAVLETISGIWLFFITPQQINNFALWFFREELGEDPKDLIANYLIKLAENLSVSSLFFGSLYLISHGIVKIVLIVALWKRKLWAYPISIVVFFGFMIYQIYRYTHSPSIYLIFLTVLDVIVIVLTWLEYRWLRRTMPIALPK